jgi:hypothetical protein
MKNLFVYFLLTIGIHSLNAQEIVSIQQKLILLDSINKYRMELGLNKLKYSEEVENLCKIRTKTISNHIKSIDFDEYKKNFGSHLHKGFYLDYLDFNTKLQLYSSKFTITRPTENVCHIPQKSENISSIVNLSFKGWKNSPDHWDGMMEEGIDHISLDFRETEIGIIADMILFKRFEKK